MNIYKINNNKFKISFNFDYLSKLNINYDDFMAVPIEKQSFFINILNALKIKYNLNINNLNITTVILPDNTCNIIINNNKLINNSFLTYKCVSNFNIYVFTSKNNYIDLFSIIKKLNKKINKNNLYLFKNNYYLILNKKNKLNYIVSEYGKRINNYILENIVREKGILLA